MVHQTVGGGGPRGPAKTGSIRAMPADGTVVAEWNLLSVVPVRWTGPSLSTESAKVATETLEFAHHGFTVLGRRPRCPLRSPSPRQRRARAPTPVRAQGRARLPRAPRPADGPPEPAARWPSRPHRLPVQPQGPHAEQVGQVGAERRRRAARRAPSRSSAVAEPSKLTLEMFFDASDTQDDTVVKTVEQLFACCVPTEESHQAKIGCPPWVIFHWGASPASPRTSSPCRSSTRCSPRRHADPRHRDGQPRGDRRRAGGPEPDLGRAGRPPRAHGGRGRQPAVDRVEGVRRPDDLAGRRAANDIDDPMRLRAGTHARAARRRGARSPDARSGFANQLRSRSRASRWPPT